MLNKRGDIFKDLFVDLKKLIRLTVWSTIFNERNISCRMDCTLSQHGGWSQKTGPLHSNRPNRKRCGLHAHDLDSSNTQIKSKQTINSTSGSWSCNTPTAVLCSRSTDSWFDRPLTERGRRPHHRKGLQAQFSISYKYAKIKGKTSGHVAIFWFL